MLDNLCIKNLNFAVISYTRQPGPGWGKLNNVKMVNAIMATVVIHAVRGYPGYLVLENDNKIQILYK